MGYKLIVDDDGCSVGDDDDDDDGVLQCLHKCIHCTTATRGTEWDDDNALKRAVGEEWLIAQ